MMHPEKYGQELDCLYGQHWKAAVTSPELYLRHMSLSEMRIECWSQNEGMPQKLRAANQPKSLEEGFEDVFATARLWIHQFRVSHTDLRELFPKLYEHHSWTDLHTSR